MAKVIDATLKLIDQFTPTLRAVNTAMDSSKAAMNGVKSHVSSMVSKMEEMNKVNQRTAKNFQRVGKSMASLQNVAVVGTLTAAAKEGFNASMKINEAVNQTKIWGDVSDEAAAKLKNNILSVSSTYGIANDKVAEATQQAIKAGVKESEVMTWMSSTAEFARVSKLDLADATKLGTQIGKAYSLTTEQQATAYNQLATAAKACHGDVDKITTSIAAISPKAAQAGISLTQLTATMAMMRSRGYDESQAGGILDNMITSITKAQPKLAQMGIDVSAARMQAEGLGPVIADIYAKMGDDSKFKALFRNVDSYKMAMMMASKDGVSEWNGMLNQINNSSESTLDKMCSQMQTPAEKTQQAMTDLANAWVTVGDALAPVFTQSATMIKAVVAAYNGLSDGQKKVIADIIQFVIIFGAVTVAMGGAMSMIGTWVRMANSIGPAIKHIGDAIDFLGKHLKQLTSVFGLIGKAASFLMANPILLVIMAIIAAGYLLYTHWDQVKAAMAAAWAGIVNTFEWAVNAIVPHISGIIEMFQGVIDFVTGVFTGNWEQAWQGVCEIFEGYFDQIQAICETVLSGIKEAINAVISGINNVSVDIPSWVPVVGGKHYQPNIPYLAQGTEFWQGGPAIINEKNIGGEVVNLPQGAQVIPHDNSLKEEYQRGKADAAQGSSSITIAKLADTIVLREDADIDRIAKKLAEKLHAYAMNNAEGAV
ncbi:hypothetical protein AB840_10000 [Megasphaera cerevisiae DSM 20462]|uniref:Phage tail tape measure protein domain-containing protein n=1 Tax=Megasphaera cerevisiae DSM 20462 TaxID=1122219 RepID=A0A0J6WRI9_9FIRM|nr:phage tail tape measure protein [Megasphaera cerevisiae]KMO86065.1 hypothetical protein AB840_10000 [Megasphaera cerevisiae DSM 20462]SKA01728.1 phage tail tape measure protein, TP901 family, core region [Megasphaera cerevisiae DSM 20462]